jgi:hypothetical protein
VIACLGDMLTLGICPQLRVKLDSEAQVQQRAEQSRDLGQEYLRLPTLITAELWRTLIGKGTDQTGNQVFRIAGYDNVRQTCGYLMHCASLRDSDDLML